MVSLSTVDALCKFKPDFTKSMLS